MCGAKKTEETKQVANKLFHKLKHMHPAFDVTSTGAVTRLVVLDIEASILPEGLVTKITLKKAPSLQLTPTT